MKSVLVLILSIFCSVSFLGAQKVLSFDEYLELVRDNHPIIQQANIDVEKAKMGIRESRGAFDPKLFSYNSQKVFNEKVDKKGKNYYALSNSGLEIPTWFGAKVKAGYEVNDGIYLNPENSMPSEGLTYLGVELPLLQGLIIDERRATLREAQLMEKISVQNRILVSNDVLLNAIENYWKWYYYYNQYQLYVKATERAKVRYQGVRTGFFVGNNSAVDTLEALIQFQNRQITLNDAKLDYAIQSLKLSNFLWDSTGVPLQVGNETQPEQFEQPDFFAKSSVDTLRSGLTAVLDSHPKLTALQYKLDQLEIQKRWKTQKLLPKVKAKYNLLRKDIGFSGFVFDNNYKWGLELNFPILLRKERGILAQTNLKIQSIEYETSLKKLELTNKINSYIFGFENSLMQLDLTTRNAKNYNDLFKAEQIKMSIGGSSLLKLNLREIKLLEANSKMFKTQAKSYTSYYKVLWAEGKL